jgi:hypothetical protein
MKPNNLMGVMAAALLICLCVSGVTAAPVAEFSGTPTSGSAPLAVTFTDESTGSPAGWAWFFGDENFTEAWTQVNAGAGWAGRRGHSSVVLPDGSIVLMGGHDQNIIFKNDTWQSTDNGTTWTQLADAGWPARSRHTSVVLPDGSIVLMGGTDGISYKNDTWRSTDNGTTWTQLADAGWAGRYSHSSVVLPDGSIVLMGGIVLTGGIDSSYKNDTWRSTDNGTTWTQMTASAGWTARASHSSVVLPDGSIVLMGGSNGVVRLNDTWRSTDNGTTWTQMTASARWLARAYHSSVAMPDGSIVLTGGGIIGSYKNDTWRSTDNGATWTQLPDAGWTARGYHSSVVMPDSSIVLMGGYDGVSGARNDVWRFNPVNSSVKAPSHTYTLPGIYNVALQVYNDGGYNSTLKAGYITVLLPLPGFTKPATDPDADGLYEDLNGNERMDFNDVVLMFNQMQWIAANEPVSAFDFNGNGRIDFNDIVKLFGEI